MSLNDAGRHPPPSNHPAGYPDMPPLPDHVETCNPTDWWYFVSRVGPETTAGYLDISGTWQLPEWTEMVSPLTWEQWRTYADHEKEGPEPRMGDLLWIWLWTDQTDAGPVDRIYVRVEHKEIPPDEMAELLEEMLQGLLEAMSTLKEDP